MYFSTAVAAEAADVNSIWLFMIYAFVTVFVVVQSTVYLVQSLRRAKKIGMDLTKIKKIITSSLTFSILPSIGIFIGVVGLAGALGLPLPAIRENIVGAIHYETSAADWVAGYVDGGLYSGLRDMLEKTGGAISPSTFVTFVAAMTFGIIWGPLYCLLFYKKTQPAFNKLTKKNEKWGQIMFAAVFMGMVLGYIAVATAEIFYFTKTSYYPILAVAVAALVMWGLDYLVQKKNQQWLDNFSLAISMFSGMAAVGVVNALV